MQTEAQQHWQAREEVIVRILQGREFNQNEFVEAVDFFQKLTGIPSHDSGTYIGRMPNEQLEKDLEAWRVWYTENSAYLRWNPTSRLVEVDETAKAAQRHRDRS